MKKPKQLEAIENLEVTKKLKKMTILDEFKAFALRGNVIDLAVGVIIGGAFQKIVTSVVNDLIMPFVGMFTGSINFTDRFVILNRNGVPDDQIITTLTDAKNAGMTTWNYGSFITSLIDFIIMAFVIFLLVKLINRISLLGKKPEKVEAAPTTKKCPYCFSEIDIQATRCPHCTSEQPKETHEQIK